MERLFILESMIRHHKALYYQGCPEISDCEYDKLEEELKNLDEKSPVLDLVGSAVVGGEKIKHASKMLSLNKTYEFKELLAWIGKQEVISTFKLDGVSCSLIYENGRLSLAKTRGDGAFGEEITKKVLWMDSIPQKIADKSSCEVRGELYCTEEKFHQLSDEMNTIGLERPSSRRNIVAGLMGRKENLELCRHITFQAFELIFEENKIKTEDEKFSRLKKLGFQTPKAILHKDEKNLSIRIEEAKSFMAKGDCQIDGLVFSYNDINLHNSLGETAHHPRYKMAFKFQGESKQTVLQGIQWSVSRNGILTPIGQVASVELAGAKISRVSLHNYGLVKEFNLKKGDVIEIIRSGEVIPKFLSVVKSSKGKMSIPGKCPACQGDIDVETIRLLCKNRSCQGRQRESVLHFIRKIGIDDISSKRLDEMIEQGLIASIPDLYKLTKEDFLKIDKVQDKLAEKFVKTIAKSKRTDLVTFLSALGIQGGAWNKCEKVVFSGVDTIEKVLALTEEQLSQVDTFAEKSAKEFYKSLRTKHSLIKELLGLGFELKKREIKASPIAKKMVCITGSLSMKRSLIEQKVRDAGGVVVSSVSNKTDFLVTNDTESSSSKFKKAKALAVPIINEKELFEMM